jgi:hypothetical protein
MHDKRDQLAERIAASRPASHTQDPSPRRAVRLGALTWVLALVWASACGGLSTAGLLQGTGADGGRALGGGAQNSEGGPSLGYDDASTVLVLTPPQAMDAQPLHSPLDASADTSGDEPHVSPALLSDGAVADRADLDADTPCGALAQCCSRLILAPPLAAACYVSAGADGGAGTCASTLATFQDSGLCP